MSELGLRILQERKKRGWSQLDLAQKVGCDLVTIYRWEKGQSDPSPYFQKKFLDVFGWSEISPVSKNMMVSSPAYWNIPYDRNPYFTGRQELLERLHALLQTKNTVLLTHAITGLGGIGKTLLAVEYAYRYHKDNRVYNAVLWAQASSQEELFSAFIAIARLFDLEEKQDQDRERVVEAVKRWLVTHTDWLLIFDNVEDMQTLKAFLPPASNNVPGHILLTTRMQAGGTIVAAALDVEPMTLEEGTTFLLRRAKTLELQQPLGQAKNDDREVAQFLCQEMGGLPLALDQAGAYIEETQCTLLQYLERYQTQRTALLSKRGDLAQGDVHPQPVTVTFLLSLEKIAQVNPAAADLLRFCAFLAPDDIPEEIFLHCYLSLPSTLQSLVATPLLFEGAIALIRRYSLVQRLATKQSLSIHRVVQAVIQDDLTEHKQRKDWELLIVAAMAELFAHAGQYSILTNYGRYIPQALASIELIHRAHFRNQSAGHLLFLMGSYLTYRAQYEQAEELCQEALDLYKQIYGSEHPEIASNLMNLAQIYEEKRVHDKAQLLLEQAIELLERVNPPQHLNRAIASCNLARCYWFRGEYVKAERMMQKTLPLLEYLVGTETLPVATGLSQLATLLRDQGKIQQAAQLYERALQIYTKLFPPNRLSWAHCLEAYATNNLFQGEIKLAESRYREALSVFEEILGKEHPDVAGCLCRLADACFGQGKFDEAERYNQRALAIYEKVWGPDYLETNQPLQGLALLSHYVKKDYAQAEDLYIQAISIIEKSQGPEHPDLVAALSNYAKLLWITNRRDKARELMRRAKMIENKILGR